ncbi:MAG: hypothetical protein ACI828_002070 [Flavobacteriales bacterium]|jgi:hypothetical protein
MHFIDIFVYLIDILLLYEATQITLRYEYRNTYHYLQSICASPVQTFWTQIQNNKAVRIKYQGV